ncbi:MAG: MCP four helix bundle domain-containing protein [Burkholderiaceae bacterium]|nr:MCP four helix bundle domain-containing protein [Burkholderiaceae bacterium]
MKLFSNLGLAQRLYLLSALLIAALSGVAVVAWLSLGGAGRQVDGVGTMRVPQMERISEAELNLTRMSLQLRHAMLVKSPSDLSATLNDLADKRKRVEASLADFEKALFTAAGREAFAKIAPHAKEFWPIAEANVVLIQAGKKDEAFAMLVDKTMPARNRLLDALGAEKKRQLTVLDQDLQEVEKAMFDTRLELAVLALIVAVALFGTAWYVARTLRRRVETARRVADRVRDGDLTVAVRDDARDEISPLLRALDEMQTALTRVVATVRQNAESVASASSQIAQGNADLSQRTEEQASTLEQTAASMEELGSTVKLNADNAKQANQLAHGATDIAVKGGEVVSQVVATMGEINSSSKRIADIIGVIDGIAFQTNILALNAAVEAARAGEQGRGFAVVAGEVRNLAQRSAEAAKEIKALITASVESVDQGSALVDRAGATMTEVVDSIRRVTDIMGEISAASSEQSSGVSQVGDAVVQMDQVTQQNAALVEESAAAAESLKSQAQQLVQAVAVFRLGAQAESRSAAPAVKPAAPAPRSAPLARPKPTAQAQPAVAAPAKAVPAQPVADAPWDGAERRSPARATNVTRLPAPAPSKPERAVANGDDDWESF